MKAALKKYRAVLYAVASIALAQIPAEKVDAVVSTMTKVAAIVATLKAATSTAPKDHEE